MSLVVTDCYILSKVMLSPLQCNVSRKRLHYLGHQLVFLADFVVSSIINLIKRDAPLIKDLLLSTTVHKRIGLYMQCDFNLSFSRYTHVQAFGKVVVETNDLAGQRELIAEYLQNEVLKPLGDLVKNTTTERKKMMSEGQELHRKLKESMDQLENVRI